MSVSKLMKSSSLFVVNQHGSCHLSIIIKLVGRGRPGGRSEHSDSWPYNKDSFVCIDSAVEECYNLSHTELHCLRARERTRERTDRRAVTDRETDRQRYERTDGHHWHSRTDSFVSPRKTIRYAATLLSTAAILYAILEFVIRFVSNLYNWCPVWLRTIQW